MVTKKLYKKRLSYFLFMDASFRVTTSSPLHSTSADSYWKPVSLTKNVLVCIAVVNQGSWVLLLTGLRPNC